MAGLLHIAGPRNHRKPCRVDAFRLRHPRRIRRRAGHGAEDDTELLAEPKIGRSQGQSKFSVALADERQAVLTAIGLGARFMSAWHKGNKWLCIRRALRQIFPA